MWVLTVFNKIFEYASLINRRYHKKDLEFYLRISGFCNDKAQILDDDGP